jgi:hypothetical protein
MIEYLNRKQERTVNTIIFIFFCSIFLGLFLLTYYFENRKSMIIVLLLAGCFLIISQKWMISKSKGIPILMFHSVTDDPSWLPWPYLCVSVRDFTEMLRLLKKKGYRSVSLTEVKNHMSGTSLISGKVVCLTFDDGYLDNWVIASPIMRKYGFFGTIFIATDFIDNSMKIRPCFDDVTAGRVKQEDLEIRGHLSIAELQRMEKEGIFTIENHTASHTCLYTSDHLKGFISPKDPKLVWQHWNCFPEKKKSWYIGFSKEQKALWGHPIFDFSRAHLVKRAYFPDEKLKEGLNLHVMENGQEAYFRNNNWIKMLKKRFNELSYSYKGYWETDAEAQERIDRELQNSKNFIENKLKKKVRYLCWPGGISTEELQAMATDKYGYWATTGGNGRNTIGENSKLLSRIYVKHRYVPFKSHFINKFLFYAEIKVFEGNYYCYIICMLFNQFNKMLKFIYRRQLRSIEYL